jgi:hypothetical protein
MAIRDNDRRPCAVLPLERAAESPLGAWDNPIGKIATQSAQLKENDRLEAQLRVPAAIAGRPAAFG